LSLYVKYFIKYKKKLVVNVANVKTDVINGGKASERPKIPNNALPLLFS
jgi:hypothetical protein